MQKSTESKKRRYSYTGLGIALGGSVGAIAQMLFGDGQIALGFAMGMAIGLVVGMIGDELRRVPMVALTGLSVGLLLGGLTGYLLDLFLTEGMATVVSAIGLAIGLVTGTIIETRRGPTG
jgi:hypothetical protein